MKQNSFWLKASVLLFSMMQMSNMCVTSVLADIALDFPAADPSVIQMLSTYPCLISILLSLVIGALTARISKKRLMQTACVLLAMAGAGGFLFHSTLPLCFLWETLLGAGLGILIPIASSVIADLFEGEERAAMMGVQSSFVGLGGVILTLLGSVLGTLAWHYNFLSMLLALPALLVISLKFPHLPPAGGKTAHTGAKVRPDWKAAIGFGLFGMLFMSCYNTIPSNVSMYLQQRGIGSPIAAGACTSAMLLGSMCSGLLFGRLTRLAGRWLRCAGIGFLTAGLLLIPATAALPLVLLCCFFAGSSLSIIMASNSFSLSQAVAPEQNAPSIGIMMALTSGGAFLSSIYTKLIVLVTGSELPSTRYLCIGCVAAAVFAALLLRGMFSRRSTAA